MLDGVMLLWFLLTALSLLYVVIDIRTTPASPVLKWGFILLTAYTGSLGAFLYVLGCREPLPGLHERYVATRWTRVGSLPDETRPGGHPKPRVARLSVEG
jgi:hypothetical protein